MPPLQTFAMLRTSLVTLGSTPRDTSVRQATRTMVANLKQALAQHSWKHQVWRWWFCYKWASSDYKRRTASSILSSSSSGYRTDRRNTGSSKQIIPCINTLNERSALSTIFGGNKIKHQAVLLTVHHRKQCRNKLNERRVPSTTVVLQ